MIDYQLIATMTAIQRRELNEIFIKSQKDDIQHLFMVLYKIFTFDDTLWETKSKTLNQLLSAIYGSLYILISITIINGII